MAAPNPPSQSYEASLPTISSKTFHIAGILTTVYGLKELSQTCKSIACLWLLHPRLATKQVMASVAASCINDWKKRQTSNQVFELIAVAFDQRNHGSREVDPLANGAWRDGNPSHAQDMFSIIQGTALDASLLMDHLESYIPGEIASASIKQHLVLGISLGGHAAWQLFFNEPRIFSAIVIIGCPDYMRVMTDRAKLSKLKTYINSEGRTFLGSDDFPASLVRSVEKSDPKGIVFGLSEIDVNPAVSEQLRLREILDKKVRNKNLLVCSGAADKLVPYHCSAPFLQFLKNATNDWYRDGNVYIEDIVYPDVGHAYSNGMVKDTSRFIGDVLAGKLLEPTSKM